MINYEGLYASLDIMWKGMAGLFIFAVFVMFFTMGIKFFLRKPPKTE